jgi:hypothetical protein
LKNFEVANCQKNQNFSNLNSKKLLLVIESYNFIFSSSGKGQKRGADKDESGVNDIFRQRQQKRAAK